MSGVQIPVLVPPSWREVVAAAGGRCQCAGACGARHAATGGQCPAGVQETVPPVRLYVAPMPHDRQESAGPLIAWCGPCWDGARRRHARQVQQTDAGMVPGQLDLLTHLEDDAEDAAADGTAVAAAPSTAGGAR